MIRGAEITLTQDAAAAATATASEAVAAKPRRLAIAIHGGAGVISREQLGPDGGAVYHAGLQEALDAGYAVLENGGSSLDAVTTAVRILEDNPLFNAGRGAVLAHDGRAHLDASIMSGKDLAAGAVTGVTTVRHPIDLARRVMEDSPHVMLSGEGAEEFAGERGLERVPNEWFITPTRKQQLERVLRGATAPRNELQGLGTVGAVAIDAQGHLAAATSTGGMTNKRWGRIGDAPIIGAGTWADENCGVSGTGWGEFYIRSAAAHDICARVSYRGNALSAAAEEVINGIVPKLGGDGGAIALDRHGNIAMPFNTSGMYRGWIKPDGTRGTAVFRDDK